MTSESVVCSVVDFSKPVFGIRDGEILEAILSPDGLKRPYLENVLKYFSKDSSIDKSRLEDFLFHLDLNTILYPSKAYIAYETVHFDGEPWEVSMQTPGGVKLSDLLKVFNRSSYIWPVVRIGYDWISVFQGAFPTYHGP